MHRLALRQICSIDPPPPSSSLRPSPVFQRPSHFIGFDIVYRLKGRGAAQTTRLTLPALRVSLPPRSQTRLTLSLSVSYSAVSAHPPLPPCLFLFFCFYLLF
jgi:hypothetical protein